MFDDDQQTPNTLNCAFEYYIPDAKPKMLEFEVRHWITNHEEKIGIGDIFYGPKGYLTMGGEDTYRTWLGEAQEPGPSEHEGGDHFTNFIDCVRSRRAEDLNAPIQEGYISAGLVHLANASCRLGRTLHFDPQTEQVIGDEEASLLLRDGDRGYRSPFVVPEVV
jgi:hypothetical protein